jgi:hypothetical protein
LTPDVPDFIYKSRRPEVRKSPEITKLRLYDRLSARGRYAGLPKDAELWRRVLDVTAGPGIRPFRNPCGGWQELYEFRHHVPILLRNYDDGVPPDCVATSLGFEYNQDLYDALDDYEQSRNYRDRNERNLDALL